MRIDDVLYFAPDVRFDEVDYASETLPMVFAARVRGFYLEPASRALDNGDAFAAGVLLVACIDALARFDVGGPVGQRFEQFARKRLDSFKNGSGASVLYLDFRNGLVHESRIKRGAQFSVDFDPEQTYQRSQGVSIVNPRRLLGEVDEALSRYVEELSNNPQRRAEFANLLQQDHHADH